MGQTPGTYDRSPAGRVGTAFRRVLYGTACLVLLNLASVRLAQAQDNPSVEYQVKAAYIFNFIKLIEWEEGAFEASEGRLIVGVIGEDRFGPALAVLDGETVGSRRIEVRRFDGIEGVDTCHVLFISASLEGRQNQVLEALRGRNVLTIGETADFVRAGGVINLIKVRDKVQFEINLDVARQAGLEISSHLLRLAVTVY